MPLPEDYVRYPLRRYGMDQDRYAWRPAYERAPIVLPGGAALAAMIVVPLEFHRLDPSGKPFKPAGAMVTPYPDLRHYTTRDYGLRIGAFRILHALKAAKLKATFAVNAALLDRVQPLIEAIVEDGHEVAAHGLAADQIHWTGLEPGVEAEWVARTRDAFDAAGLSPRTWMSPARQQSFDTLDLIANAGFDVCLDWEQDTTPIAMRTTSSDVWAVPLSNELDDRLLLVDRRQGEDEWAAQIAEAAACMQAEAPRCGGQVLGFTLTPYVSGLPFRIQALRQILTGLDEDQAIWSATASEIANAASAAAAPKA